MLVYEYPGIIRIFYEAENDLFVHEWLEYNPEDQDDRILQVLQKIYDLALEYKADKVLVRADKTKGVFSPEIQDYIRDVQFPRLANDTSLQFVATVLHEDKLQKIGAEIWRRPLLKYPELQLRDFGDEQKARDWLDSV